MTGLPIALEPTEEAPGHDFASPRHYHGDIALLNYLLQDLRSLVRRHVKGEFPLTPHQVITWEVHGLERRTVICDPVGLRDDGIMQIVGFFGDRRSDANQRLIDVSEFDLIDEFRSYPGILSYSSVELVDGYWANLVVHSDVQDRESWRGSEVHKRAVDLVAPDAYHGVRIHNGCILEGVCSSSTVLVESTKYWNYDTSPVWHALRVFPGGRTVRLAEQSFAPPLIDIDRIT
jgi:hypothetical protein